MGKDTGAEHTCHMAATPLRCASSFTIVLTRLKITSIHPFNLKCRRANHARLTTAETIKQNQSATCTQLIVNMLYYYSNNTQHGCKSSTPSPEQQS